MLVRFSQKWAKEKYGKLVRETINFVKGSRSAPDLLIKVFFYKTPFSATRGTYRNLWIHGGYASEFDYEKVEHVITLKIATRTAYCIDVFEVGDYIPNIQIKQGEAFVEASEDKIIEDIIGLFAHEFKHYLDMRKLRSKKKWRHWEVRANQFSKKILEKWRNQN